MKKEELTGKLNKGGFATLEIMIALAIAALSLTFVAVLSFGGQSILVDSETNADAIYIAQKQIESGRSSLRENFFGLASIAPATEDIYTKILSVDWIDDYVKKLTSQVTWQTENNRPQSVELTTLITNWEGALRGDTCNPQMLGDWQNPQIVGHADFSSNEGATDLDTRINKVYITTDPSAADKPDFYIVDTIDPQNPSVLAQINTGNGLEGVRVWGNYAFTANRSINGQLQVINVSDSANPFVVSSFKIPGTTSGGYGKTVFYQDQKIYLGLYKDQDGPEFNIIDVSDPVNPHYLGGWEATSTINEIYVKNGIAYLATTQPDPGTEERNLIVLDVSNPSSISEIGNYVMTNTTLSQAGRSFYMDGDTLYFGRTDGANCSSCYELFVLDVSDPYNIGILGAAKIGSTVSAMVLRENYIFMMTGEANLGFQIWNVQDFGNITMYSSLNTQQAATGGMDCEGNSIYIGQRSNRALQIIGPGMDTASVLLTIHDGGHNAISTAVLGDTIHAKASVLGSGFVPTGNVDFRFYTSGNCGSGEISDPSNPFALDLGGIIDPSSEQGPLGAGSYSFRVFYSGDVNYNPANSTCVSLSVPKQTPNIATTIYSNANGQPVTSVPQGTEVYAGIEVSGTITPSGTVDFILYKNKDNCTGQSQTQPDVPLVSGVAQSSVYTTLNKDISYKVHYNGDSNYNAADGVCQMLDVQ